MNGLSASIGSFHQADLCGTSWTSWFSDAVPTFVNFILANQCRWHSLNCAPGSGSHAAGVLRRSGMPPLGVTGAGVKKKSDLTLGLKLVSINVRTLHDSGKMKFVAAQLHKMKADVVFVQETRLPASADLQHLDGFQLFATPSPSGHGGLLVMVREDPLFVVDKYHTHSPRVMSVHMHIDSICVRLVCAHAPIAESPAHDHEEFARDMAMALGHIEAGEIVMTGCDLNARLATLIGEFQCIGPHACSTCPADAAFRRSCLAHFDTARLVAANTILQDDQGTTWRHPSGTEHQIDFILVPHHLVECGRIVSAEVGHWGVFDCHTTTDHRHVAVTVVLTSTATRGKKKRLHARVKVAGPQHLRDFQQDLARELTAWDGVQPANTYIQYAMEKIATTLKDAAPRASQPKKPWITSATWNLMWELNKWR
eukprot:4168309-Amphidinium_carterae.2